MRILVGRPRLARAVAGAIYYAPLVAVLYLGLLWVNTRQSEPQRYRALQREISAWESRARRDSLAADSLDRAVAEAASLAADRLTPELVREQHAKYGHIIFAPDSLVAERVKMKDRMDWEQRQVQKAKSALYNWLNEASEGRDTLGGRHYERARAH